MSSEQNGLATAEQIEALADTLSACADSLHERVMKDIRAHKDAPPGPAAQALARKLLEDEIVLRQRANALYADAATLVVESLSQSQQQVILLTTAAADTIGKIGMIGGVTGLVGGLLLLAGAAATGQAVAIVAALEKVRKQVKVVAAHQPKKPA